MATGQRKCSLAVRLSLPHLITPDGIDILLCTRYNPHSDESFYFHLIQHCYNSPIEDTCPRRLALLFMIMAVACLVDLRRPPYSAVAETYHTVARAALSEISVMEDTNVETVLALFYEIWYLLVFSDKKKAAGYAWGLMGLTAKLAQSVCLDLLFVSSAAV